MDIMRMNSGEPFSCRKKLAAQLPVAYRQEGIIKLSGDALSAVKVPVIIINTHLCSVLAQNHVCMKQREFQIGQHAKGPVFLHAANLLAEDAEIVLKLRDMLSGRCLKKILRFKELLRFQFLSVLHKFFGHVPSDSFCLK